MSNHLLRKVVMMVEVVRLLVDFSVDIARWDQLNPPSQYL
jgi:hypothetical protein